MTCRTSGSRRPSPKLLSGLEEKLKKLKQEGYELRVSRPVRKHKVRAHSRGGYTFTYLAKRKDVKVKKSA